jgi:serine/threonine protein kinase
VVHRDLKPENILLDRSGRWCLADFGIASAPGESGAAGTLAFAAPEQLRGVPQDEGVDRYAIAAVAFFALTGHLPFIAHDPELQLWRQQQGIDWSASWASRVPPPARAWSRARSPSTPPTASHHGGAAGSLDRDLALGARQRAHVGR